MRVAEMATPGSKRVSSPKKVPANSAYYLRPVGTMYANWDNTGSGNIMPFIYSTPYHEVTWRNMSTATGTPSWGYKIYNSETDFCDSLVSNERDLTVAYGYEYEDVPALMMGSVGPYELSGYSLRNGSSATSGVASVINSKEAFGDNMASNLLCSAHYYGSSDRFGTQEYGWSYYSGAAGPDYNPDLPASDPNQDRSGYWFGRNWAGWNVAGTGFEKPSTPYVLNNIYMWVTALNVTEDVDLEARVYRLPDGLPQYCDSAAVIDPELLNDDNLIATGRTTITTDMNEDGSPILKFDLFEYDPELGMEYEVTPEVDDAIVVLITGLDQDAIVSMSGLFTTDEEDDGVGEVTYLGHSESGVVTALVGINNFFQSGEMRCGNSIFIDVSRPFMLYNIPEETGEYTFSSEGGSYVLNGHEGVNIFGANQYGEDLNGDNINVEGAPDWLTILLTNGTGEYEGTVDAKVECAPLPEGTPYREAMVRFYVNGAHLQYFFAQGAANFITDENGLVYVYNDANRTATVIYKGHYKQFTRVVIPHEVTKDGVAYAVTGISAGAFNGCRLESVSIYADIEDGGNGFSGCTVGTLYVADNVTTMRGLGIDPNEIYSFGNTPAVCDGATFKSYQASLHVSESAMVDYFMADIWCNFNNISPDSGEQPKSLSLSRHEANVGLAGSLQLTATVSPSTVVPVNWTSTDPAVVGVDNNGMVTSKNVGEADIVVTCMGLRQVCHVISQGEIAITLDKHELTLEKDSVAYLTATTHPADADVIWESSNNNVVTVVKENGRAKVQAVSRGEALIIARGDKDYVTPDTCRISVADVIVNLAIDRHELEMWTNDVAYLTASSSPIEVNVNWKSTDTHIATVTVENGRARVNAVAAGEVMIVAYGDDDSVLPDTCRVTVRNLEISVSIDQHMLDMKRNDIVYLTATTSPVTASVSWSSSNTQVALVRVVGGRAMVLANRPGEAMIIATAAGDAVSPDTCRVTVRRPRGDVNNDGLVDAGDVNNLINIVLGKVSDFEISPFTELNGDGIIDVLDVNLLINVILGKVTLEDVQTFTVGGVSFKMVEVEGGTFTMGATSEQGSDARDGEKPAHQVTLSSYSIGQTEVTQELWQAVMGSNPSSFTGDLQRPVERVSWNDCQTFISKLNQLTGKNFRLPTEAEWEYAARGGNRSQGYKYAGSNNIGDVAWYTSNSASTTHAVATKAPNELGLYDMSGNVREWCQDWNGSYSSAAQTDPAGPATGSSRVNRGGIWYSNARDCRVSHRGSTSPSNASIYLGLRLAL